MTAPRYAEVERAIRSVPGVADASVVEAAGGGRGRLRIRLHPGEDAERVAWSVAATLRERFGIALDPEEIRPRMTAEAEAKTETEPEGNGHDRAHPQANGVAVDAETVRPGLSHDLVVEELAEVPPPPPAPAHVDEARPAGNGPAPRPVIRDLRSSTDDEGVVVTATLDLAGRLAEGRSLGVPTSRGLLRTIAEATVMALGELTGNPLRAQVDRVSLGGSDPTTVTVVVTLLSARGEELLLGASIVRDDVEHAVMRATLDALNRRVEPDLAV